tara:strand:- start:273 stop:479 length:207 start_codon:yes stop_codon:yes gene_type:complete
MTEQEANKIIKQEVEALGWTFTDAYTYEDNGVYWGASFESVPNTYGHPQVMVRICIKTKKVHTQGRKK